MPQERVPRIRKNLESNRDPYIADQERYGVEQCKECRAVYYNHRWYLPDSLPTEVARKKLKESTPRAVLCPACRKIHDQHPGGVVTLSGSFLETHRDDILNLARNEDTLARNTNPLDRIISIDEDGANSIVIQTTKEKLAQRIGRAIQKAYAGELQIQWPEDGNLARVNWRREA